MEATAVLFDLDNTLIDRPRQLVRYSECFAEHFSDDLQPIEFAQLHGEILAGDGGGYLPKQQMFVQLRERLAWRRVPELAEISGHWCAHSPQCAVEMEGAVALLNEPRVHSIDKLSDMARYLGKQ